MLLPSHIGVWASSALQASEAADGLCTDCTYLLRGRRSRLSPCRQKELSLASRSAKKLLARCIWLSTTSTQPDTRVLDLDGLHLFPYELESLLNEGLAVGGDRHTHCLKPRANTDRPVVHMPSTPEAASRTGARRRCSSLRHKHMPSTPCQTKPFLASNSLPFSFKAVSNILGLSLRTTNVKGSHHETTGHCLCSPKVSMTTTFDPYQITR